jgi:hypothetical protein
MSVEVKERPSLNARLLVALAAAIAGGLYCYFSLKASGGPRPADDFTWHWLAARALLAGQNPYEVIKAGGLYHLDAPYVYPLTTAVAAVPFAAFLSPAPAAALWIAVGTGLLAFAVTKVGWTRLLMFCSMPYLWAANAGQISPIMTAAAILPWLGFIAPVKPQIGIGALSYKPNRVAIVGTIAFIALTLAVNPAWPKEWIAILPQRVANVYRPPVTVMGGPLLLLALFRWRRADARLLLVMSLVPQNMLFYDQLLLWLIPRTRNELMILGTLSLVAPLVASIGMATSPDIAEVNRRYAPAILWLIYVPCLIMVLRRKNEACSSGEQTDPT